MELAAILAAIEASCDGKQGSDGVQLPAEVVLAAQQELKGKAQMARDLEMARDEASMKPSVARKLNEKIRALEAELEELRSNRKVKELEKKVQFLEHELKQSYTTKNFTLKSGLLELEKQYRAHMNVDPAMAAFWDDITVLLDEKKDRDTFQPKGPRTTAPSAAAGSRRASTSDATPSTPPAPATAAAAGEQSTSAGGQLASPRKGADAPPSPSSGGGTAGGARDAAGPLEHSNSATAVQMQVESFNTIISEEAASAATMQADHGSGPKQGSGEMVVRHGAGFRVVRPAGTKDPQADVVAADSRAAAAAKAAGGEPAEQQQHQQQPHKQQQQPHKQQQQQAGLLQQDFASRIKDVTFKAIPASKQQQGAAAAPLQQPVATAALEQQSDAVASSLQDLLQQFGDLAAAAGSLPQPPAPAGAPDQPQPHQQQQQLGEVDTASLWQHQLQQLLQAAQQLKQQVAGGSQAADALQQQQATAAGLLESVDRMQAVLGSARSSDDDSRAAVAAAVQKLAGLKQEVLLLLQSLQRLAAESGGQRMLVSVFGEFLSQLEQQGVLAPEAAAAAAADAQAASGEEKQPAVLSLLQSFLDANPQVPQMLAVQLAPAVPPKQQEEAAAPAVELASGAVQAVADAEHREVQAVADAQHQEVQAVADAQHQEVQAVADAEHREIQCEAAEAQHAGTQSEALPVPSDHAETQTEAAEAGHVETQTDAAAADHAGTQTEVVQPPVSHVSTQAAAESASAEVQTTPPSPVAAAVQAELRPEVSEAGSQVDLPAAAVATAAAAAAVPAAAREAAEVQPEAGEGPSSSAEAEASNGTPEGAPAASDASPTATAAAAAELSQLKADNMELAANLQVTQSLVDHLNTNLKAAIDKADDAEAEAAQVKQQLDKTVASLNQLQAEHADVTHVLIEAKVEIAEKKGELLKLVRDMKRAIAEQRANPVQNAAGVVKELENILAVMPSANEDADIPASPASATAASRQGSSFDISRHGGLAGLAAGLGHMRDAFGGLGAAGRAKTATARTSDSSSAQPAAGQGGEGLATAGSGAAAAVPTPAPADKA